MDSPDDAVCIVCEAELCPCCGSWFADYDALLAHLDSA